MKENDRERGEKEKKRESPFLILENVFFFEFFFFYLKYFIFSFSIPHVMYFWNENVFYGAFPFFPLLILYRFPVPYPPIRPPPQKKNRSRSHSFLLLPVYSFVRSFPNTRTHEFTYNFFFFSPAFFLFNENSQNF